MSVQNVALQVKEAFTFLWKIEHFNVRLMENRHLLRSATYELAKSPTFSVPYTVCGNKYYEDFHLRLVARDIVFLRAAATIHRTTVSHNTSFYYTVCIVSNGDIEMVRSGVYSESDECTKEKEKNINYLRRMKHACILEDTLTLQCRIWTVEAERSVKNVKCVARSILPVSRYTFDIKVPCVDSECLIFQKEIPIFKHCPNFEVSINWNKWNLDMLWDKTFSGTDTPFVYKLYLKKSSGALHYLAECDIIMTSRNSLQLDTSQIEMIKMLPGDVNLHFDIFFFNGKTEYISTIERYSEGDDELCLDHEIPETSLLMLSDETHRTKSTETDSLRQDLNRLHSEQKLCDFTLEVAGTSFPVHTAILAARSLVFASMFEADMREKKSKIAEVPDVDSDTMERFLQYLYCDTLQDLSTESASMLYFAADKYQVESLKTLCSTFLKSTLSVQTVCQVLTLADMHQDEELLAGCKEFIFSRAKEVFLSDQWTSLNKENLQLSNDVMREAFSKLL